MTDHTWFKAFIVASLVMAVILLSHISFQLRHLDAVMESFTLQHQADGIQLQWQTVLLNKLEKR